MVQSTANRVLPADIPKEPLITPAKPGDSTPPAPFPGSTNRHSTAVLFVLVILLGVLQALLFKPYYQINDDVAKIFFVQGVGTALTPNDYVVYSNAFWGLILKSLFTAFPGVPWYGILIYAVQTLSMGAVLYALYLFPDRKLKIVLFLAAYPCLYLYYFIQFQYTQTASLAAQGGLFLAVSLWVNRGKSHPPAPWLLSGTLLVLSSLVRLDALILTVFYAFPFLAYSLWPTAGPSRGNFLAERKWFLFLTLALTAAGFFYDWNWYNRDPAWREFKAFDEARLELMDYRIQPDITRAKPFLDKVGWTPNDLRMFNDWYYLDKDIYSTGKILELADHFPRFGAEGKPATYRSLGEIFRLPLVQIACFCFAAFLLLASPRQYGMLILQFGWALATLAFLLYFWRAPIRVIQPLWSYLAVVPLFCAEAARFSGRPNGNPRRSFLTRGIPLVIAALFGAVLMRDFHKLSLAEAGNETLLRQSIERLNPRADQLFVVWGARLPIEYFNLFDNLQAFKKFRLFRLAVHQRTPLQAEMLKRFGIKNLFQDMTDRPDVFLICAPDEGGMVVQYMREKYGREVFAEKTFDSPLFKAYRIHSRPSPFQGPAKKIPGPASGVPTGPSG